MKADAFVFLNDKIIPANEASIPINDLAVLRGYGVFDFFRTQNRKPFHLADHLQRFRNSAHSLNLNLNFSDEQIESIVSELVALHNYTECGLRMELTGGNSEDGMTPLLPNFFITVDEMKFPDDSEKENGIRVITDEYQREIPEVKTINYLNSIRLLPLRKMQNAGEVLYHFNGIVTEFSRSNIFILSNHQLFTPQRNILKGITRKIVMQAAEQEFHCVEKDLSMQDVLNADEVFLTGTGKKVLSVSYIDFKMIGNGKPGSCTKRIQNLFSNYEQCW